MLYIVTSLLLLALSFLAGMMGLGVAFIATLVAPLGVWLLQFVPATTQWWIYSGVLLFLAYRMAFPPKMDDSQTPSITDGTRVKGGALSAGIGVFAGLLGVGPGFPLMPTLALVVLAVQRVYLLLA